MVGAANRAPSWNSSLKCTGASLASRVSSLQRRASSRLRPRVVSSSPQEYFGLATKDQLQTVMFLQLVAGGHLLLFITRTERWFFLPPFPAAPLFVAILLTQIVALLMCAFGWLVPSIPWTLIGWVWVYNIAWMFVLGGVRLITERYAAYRTARQVRSVHIVSQSLQPHMAS